MEVHHFIFEVLKSWRSPILLLVGAVLHVGVQLPHNTTLQHVHRGPGDSLATSTKYPNTPSGSRYSSSEFGIGIGYPQFQLFGCS